MTHRLLRIRIEFQGDVEHLYDERFLPKLGERNIYRVSNVSTELCGKQNADEWFAELEQIGGPTLGPFTTRSAAIDAERQWIEERYLTMTG